MFFNFTDDAGEKRSIRWERIESVHWDEDGIPMITMVSGDKFALSDPPAIARLRAYAES